jgi:hypothetical protein
MGNPTSTYVWHFNKGFDFFFHIKIKFFSIWNLFDFGGGKNKYIKFFSTIKIFLPEKILPILIFWQMSFKPMPIMKINLFSNPLFPEGGHHFLKNSFELSYTFI